MIETGAVERTAKPTAQSSRANVGEALAKTQAASDSRNELKKDGVCNLNVFSCISVANNINLPNVSVVSPVYWKTRTRMPDNGHRTNDGKDGQRWKRRTDDEKDGQRWKRRTNDGKDGQTMEKTDKRWKRRTNDGKDGQTMEKTDKRWKRRTNDGKDGQTMEKTDKRWKKMDTFSNRPTFQEYIGSNVGLCHIYCYIYCHIYPLW